MTRFIRWPLRLSMFATLAGCYLTVSTDAGTDAADTPVLDARVLDTDDDARTDARSGMTDVPVATGCGLDGLPCLTVGFDERPADMACLGTERAPSGEERVISFNLIRRALASNDITGDFELWHTNFVGLDCAVAAPDCEVVPETEAGNATTLVGGGWYAYRVAANTAEGTLETFGYNRRPAGAGGIDTITTLDAAVYSTLVALVRMGLSRDLEDAILLGDAVDCEGASVEG